jgi:hypothetical protein
MLPPCPDHHTELVNKALAEKSPVPGELEDYLTLRHTQDPIEAFNLFIKRWVHPSWWPHLMDNDDNEAEYVRRVISGEKAYKKAEK